jgi:hypothetical protein
LRTALRRRAIRQAWEAAIEEFFLIEAAQAQTDRPDPSDWKTEIPELWSQDSIGRT